MHDRSGESFGRYRLEQLLGRGGMAEVYRGSDEKLGRAVAVKLILPHHAIHAEFRERFLREARLVAALEHPQILPIYDFGEQDGVPFLVMPYLAGGTLAARMLGLPFPLRQVAIWTLQLAAALDAAHRAGVLHRDVKPSNVLLAGDGRAVLADFGIAKSLAATSHLTSAGAVLGTPVYMAPELAKGDPASRASDLYALAVMVYELLAGQAPFGGESALAILHRHATEPVPSIVAAQRELPLAIDAILGEALAKEPSARPPSCAAFAARLAAAAGLAPEATAESGLSAAAHPGDSAPESLAPTVVTPATAHVAGERRGLARSAVETQGPRRRLWFGFVAAAGLVALVAISVFRGWEGSTPSPVATRSPRALTPAPATSGVGSPASEPPSQSPERSPSPTEATRGVGVQLRETPPAAAREAAAASTGDSTLSGARPEEVPGSRARPEAAPHSPSSLSGAVVLPAAQQLGRWIGDRVLLALRPSRRLTAQDFAELRAASQQVDVRLARLELSREFLASVGDFALAGEAYLAGDLAGARAALARAEANPAKAVVPIAFPLLVLGREAGAPLADWELAMALGDPRDEAATALRAAETAGRVPHPQAAFARAVFERWQGRHLAAAQAAEALLAGASKAELSRRARAQVGQLAGEEWAAAGEAERAAAAFTAALEATIGRERGALAFGAGALLGHRLAQRDLAAPFFQAACAEGMQRACLEARGREGRPLRRQRPALSGGNG